MQLRLSAVVQAGQQSRLGGGRLLRDHGGGRGLLRVLQMLLLLRSQSEASAGEVRMEGPIKRSDEFPERVLKEEREVEEKDMPYLTIGIVVNAPYGRRDRVLSE